VCASEDTICASEEDYRRAQGLVVDQFIAEAVTVTEGRMFQWVAMWRGVLWRAALVSKDCVKAGSDVAGDDTLLVSRSVVRTELCGGDRQLWLKRGASLLACQDSSLFYTL
jgi:hypothetical protein